MVIYVTKKDMVYSDIKEKILNGSLKPGDRLHIRSIAKEYGTSEIPVREAIQNLEHDQLAHVVPHTGAVVALQSIEDLNEILELRIYMESLATRWAVPYMTKKHIAELEDIVSQQKEILSGERDDDFGDLNSRFHELIYEQSPNRRLDTLILNLRDNHKRYHTFFKENSVFNKGSIEEHEAIVSAIKNGDAAQAQALMHTHKERSAKQITKFFQEKWNSEE